MKRKKNPAFFLFILFLILILLLSLGYLYLNNLNKKNQTIKEVTSAMPEKTTVNTATPAPTDFVFTSQPTNTPQPQLVSLADLEAGTVIPMEQLNFATLSCYFTSEPIGEDIAIRISGKSYTENEQITLDSLRYLKLLHYNFEHEIQVGECIVNEAIAQDCIEIFTELFKAEYEIYSMHLIDDFWTGDGSSSDTASMNANNSSAFCYRVIAGTTKLSNHALGYAIDINPLQNPYITYKDGMPVYYHDNAEDYADRSISKDHMITHEDLCYQLFTEHGFTWGGDWKNSKDYQHFEKTE